MRNYRRRSPVGCAQPLSRPLKTSIVNARFQPIWSMNFPAPGYSACLPLRLLVAERLTSLSSWRPFSNPLELMPAPLGVSLRRRCSRRTPAQCPKRWRKRCSANRPRLLRTVRWRAQVQTADGGYRLSGRWNFSSGSRHATWFTAVAPLDGDDEIRMFLLPKPDVELIDVWQVNGLRGTGSFGFEAVDAFVPASRVWDPKTAPREPGPLYVIPQVLLFAASFASVALGASRTALNDAIEFAGGNRARLERDLRRDKPVVWRDVGRAEAVWSSARAFLNEAVVELWAGAQRSRSLTVDERIRLRLASTHATRLAADVTDIAYELCGSDAMFEANPVQRRFQDVHAITQQIQARLAHYDTAGQYYLGLEPEGLF